MLGKFRVEYPGDIYNFSLCKKYKLSSETLTELKNKTYMDHEVGGIINFKVKEKEEIKYLFNGGENRIKLDMEERGTQILFHTHPRDKEEGNLYDPPSPLDIVSFLGLTITYLANEYLDKVKGIEQPEDDPLQVQVSAVFTKNEVYTYYLSSFLIERIKDVLLRIDEGCESVPEFIEKCEGLLSEVNEEYLSLLSPYNNSHISSSEIDEYIDFLSNHGILLQRFTYSSQEFYIYF